VRSTDFERLDRLEHRSNLFALRLDLLGLRVQLAQQLGGAALADDQRQRLVDEPRIHCGN